MMPKIILYDAKIKVQKCEFTVGKIPKSTRKAQSAGFTKKTLNTLTSVFSYFWLIRYSVRLEPERDTLKTPNSLTCPTIRCDKINERTTHACLHSPEMRSTHSPLISSE